MGPNEIARHGETPDCGSRGEERGRSWEKGLPRTDSSVRGSPFDAPCAGYASLLRFGPPLPADSIGGTSGSAAFSSPRKVNVAFSPSPSVSTTTM